MTAAANEWIDWAGGECPFVQDRRVDVTLRDGTVRTNVLAIRDLIGCWPYVGDGGDIIAYRVVSA